jgi:hypothetical protein
MRNDSEPGSAEAKLGTLGLSAPRAAYLLILTGRQTEYFWYN